MKTPKHYMAIDQYGHSYHGLENPRKDLLSKLCRKHAQKMYVDGIDGGTYQTGYIIAGLWLSIYQVIPMRKAA
jgi:hypothetical protein